MASESIDHLAIDSEPIQARGIVVKYYHSVFYRPECRKCFIIIIQWNHDLTSIKQPPYNEQNPETQNITWYNAQMSTCDRKIA